MTKTLTKHGNSLALVIDKPILELLRIDDKTQLNVQTDGTGLYITPADPARRQEFESGLNKMMTEWHDVLKRLAE
jgi:antitoxin component of MazEF toxin-antitoxin module